MNYSFNDHFHTLCKPKSIICLFYSEDLGEFNTIFCDLVLTQAYDQHVSGECYWKLKWFELVLSAPCVSVTVLVLKCVKLLTVSQSHEDGYKETNSGRDGERERERESYLTAWPHWVNRIRLQLKSGDFLHFLITLFLRAEKNISS